MVKIGDLVKAHVGETVYKVTAVLDGCVFAHTLDGYEFPHIQRLDFDFFEIVKEV